MSTMLSRSGQTNPEGKLLSRFDIPVTEALNERAIIAASKHGTNGVSKAEYLRAILESALADGCWFPLNDKASQSLSVLCAVHDATPGQYLAKLVDDELTRRFSMLQIMAQTKGRAPLDESPTGGGA